eukprot:TRINITY_DN280_c0_g1_i1.p1 TRINITY_DN280_c0_g1~~TRINITY_DN280_c0_g1_i1.p1  ORF type:complete len:415 (+),score=125.86 TRINITY_DN280_c0_g1_i1:58-1302(+)
MATVDRTLNKYNADLASRAVIADGLDARLALIDPSENVDKYYILQGLEDPELEGDERYFSFQHWGRTGTAGDGKLEGPSNLEDAKARLSKVFKEKTGSEWGEIQPGDRAPPGKYWLQQIATNDEKAVWEYYVGDGVDGKRPGWYPYAEDASMEVEAIYAQHEANERESRTANRVVESGYFTYKVDLEKMTQENTKTKKVREIRRTVGGQGEGSQPATAQDLSMSARRAMKATEARAPPPMKARAPPPMKATSAAPRTAMRAAPLKVMKTATKRAMKAVSARKKPAAKTKAAMKKTPMKAMKKVMKKAMKAKKAMKSKIAKGKLAKAAVWGGKKEKTSGGKQKDDLMKNKAGKIVSKKKSAAGRKHFANVARWVAAVKQARSELGITGFAAIKKGTALYDKAKELLPTVTPITLD